MGGYYFDNLWFESHDILRKIINKRVVMDFVRIYGYFDSFIKFKK